MKRIFILAVLLISLAIAFVSCKGSKICPAYGQHDTEQSESSNS